MSHNGMASVKFDLQFVVHCSNTRIAVSTDHRSQNYPRGVVSVPGAVWLTVDYRERYWNAIGKSDRLYYYYSD